MSPAASHATSISRSLLDQNDSVSILVTGIVSDHLNREPIRADRGKDINAARFHRRACVVRSNALLQIARFAYPAGACPQAKRLVEASQEYLALEFNNNLGRSHITLATDEEGSPVTRDHLPRLLRLWAVRRTTETAIKPSTAELAFHSYPGCGDDAVGTDHLGIDSSEFARPIHKLAEWGSSLHRSFTALRQRFS